MNKTQNNWTVADCIRELTQHGWVYEGRVRFYNVREPLYRWSNPTGGDPNNIPEYAFTMREMRNLCRSMFATSA